MVREPVITETSQAAPTRLVGVDGLRALAAMFVFVQHVWRFGSPDGFSPDIGPFDSVLSHFRVGVTLFFVLSGFLLYRPFVAAIRDARPLPRFRSYFRSRALRILPAYWVILFATAFLLQTFLQRESVSHEDYRSPHDLGQLFGAIVFVQNYVPSWLQAGIGTAWSLNVEIVFYLVLPLLVLLAGALASRARTSRGRWLSLLAPVFVLLVVGASGKIAARFVDGVGPSPGFDGDWHSVIARSFWFHADLFAVGLTLALCPSPPNGGRRSFRAAGDWVPDSPWSRSEAPRSRRRTSTTSSLRSAVVSSSRSSSCPMPAMHAVLA